MITSAGVHQTLTSDCDQRFLVDQPWRSFRHTQVPVQRSERDILGLGDGAESADQVTSATFPAVREDGTLLAIEAVNPLGPGRDRYGCVKLHPSLASLVLCGDHAVCVSGPEPTNQEPRLGHRVHASSHVHDVLGLQGDADRCAHGFASYLVPCSPFLLVLVHLLLLSGRRYANGRALSDDERTRPQRRCGRFLVAGLNVWSASLVRAVLSGRGDRSHPCSLNVQRDETLWYLEAVARDQLAVAPAR